MRYRDFSIATTQGEARKPCWIPRPLPKIDMRGPERKVSVPRSSSVAISSAAPHPACRFGRSWQRSVSTYLDPDRQIIAAQSLRELVGDLQGKAFPDIGRGSRFFSLCVYRCGASRITSFDVDLDSVEAARPLFDNGNNQFGFEPSGSTSSSRA